jgi:hypothetical protein
LVTVSARADGEDDFAQGLSRNEFTALLLFGVVEIEK